jgi:putative transposase
MSRPLRLEYPGALWHVTSRGNEKSAIFLDDSDRRLFLGVLAEVVQLCSWRLHAYVLMGNHFHLLLETPETNLSRGMHRLNAIYSQKFNAQHDRVGHLMQGRFKSILVEKERHLLELVRYLVLNPVRAGLVTDVAEWPWSNYRATAGLEPAPPWLETRWTVSQFGDGGESIRAYAEFVRAGASGLEPPWRRVTDQLFLGSEDFRRRLRREVERAAVSPEMPRQQTSLARPTAQEVVSAAATVLRVESSEVRKPRRTPLRLAVAYIARHDCLLTLPQVGAVLGVSANSACEIASCARRLRIHDDGFRELLKRVRGELRRVGAAGSPKNGDLTPEVRRMET